MRGVDKLTALGTRIERAYRKRTGERSPGFVETDKVIDFDAYTSYQWCRENRRRWFRVRRVGGRRLFR